MSANTKNQNANKAILDDSSHGQEIPSNIEIRQLLAIGRLTDPALCMTKNKSQVCEQCKKEKVENE